VKQMVGKAQRIGAYAGGCGRSPDLQSTRFTPCAGQDEHPRLDKTPPAVAGAWDRAERSVCQSPGTTWIRESRGPVGGSLTGWPQRTLSVADPDGALLVQRGLATWINPGPNGKG
jgi:hypothetical protein